MSKHVTMTVHKGCPRDILISVSQEIADVLKNAGISPTGVHVAALFHVAVCAVKAAVPAQGQMPSYGLLLKLLTGVMTGTEWNAEEVEFFNKEMTELIVSAGGSTMPDNTTEDTVTGATFMAPATDLVH